MPSRLEAEYKGYTIRWEDYQRVFAVLLDDMPATTAKLESVEDCEKWIDKQLKVKYKRVKVLYQPWANRTEGWVDGEATSIVDDTDVWVISKRTGNRSKERLGNVVIKSNENDALIARLKALADRIADLTEEQKTITAFLERLTPAMMTVDGEAKEG